MAVRSFSLSEAMALWKAWWADRKSAFSDHEATASLCSTTSSAEGSGSPGSSGSDGSGTKSYSSL